MNIDYLDKFKGTLMGVAIGDTLGAPFEGMVREEIQEKFKDFGDYFTQNKKIFNTITDDTQLTIHLAKALITGNGFKRDNVIREFVSWLDDPPIGAGYGCLSSIKKLKYNVPWQNAASNSGGNGTTMRIAPVGLLFNKDPKGLREAAIKSSEITHNHSAATAGAVLIATAIAYLVNKKPGKEIPVDQFFNIIISSISNTQDEIWQEFIGHLHKLRRSLDLSIESGLLKFSQIGVKAPYFIEHFIGKVFVHPYTISTVICALFLFLKYQNSFRGCIYSLATAGGDTDTVAAIGGCLTGAYLGFDNIPQDLIKIVKKRKKIIKISEELCETFENRYHIG